MRLGPFELGEDSAGNYTVGVCCSVCLRRHGANTVLALLQRAQWDPPGTPWSWVRVGRSGRRRRGLIQFARVEDGSSSRTRPGAGVELLCQRCGARPRVSFDRLNVEAEAVRSAGVSIVNV